MLRFGHAEERGHTRWKVLGRRSSAALLHNRHGAKGLRTARHLGGFINAGAALAEFLCLGWNDSEASKADGRKQVPRKHFPSDQWFRIGNVELRLQIAVDRAMQSDPAGPPRLDCHVLSDRLVSG